MHKTVLGILLICLLGSASSSRCQSLDDVLGQLQNPNPIVRIQAFYDLQAFGHSNSDRMKRAMIDLLALENAYVPKQTSLDEGYADYYGAVVQTVATLNDIRALDPLLDVMDTGAMATDALARFGGPALDPVITQSHNPDASIRLAAVIVLKTMLEPPNFELVNDPVSLSKIRATLEKSAQDRNRHTRKSALEGLAILSSRYDMQDLPSCFQQEYLR